MGCNLLYTGGEYENFIMEATIVNHDNDGIGFVFGWQSISDHYQAVAINDNWPSPAADGVDGPFMKLKRRDPALTCSSSMDASTTCFETLSYVDGEGMSSDPGGAVFDMYHATYHDYLEDATVGVKVYLVVKDGEARWGWWDKEKQKWMMTWAELPADYSGGKVGFTTFADQYLVEDVYITDLDATPDPEMCNGGGSCVFGACQCFNDDDYYWPTTGLCEPPTVVGAGVVCLGNGESRRPIEIDGSLRTLEGDTDAEGGWLSACDEDVTYGTCAWDFVSLSLIHISEPTRRTPISYAVFCLKKKK